MKKKRDDFEWRTFGPPELEFTVAIRQGDREVFVSAILVCMALGVDQIDWPHGSLRLGDSSMPYYRLSDVVTEHLEIFKEVIYTRHSVTAARAILREVLAETQGSTGSTPAH